MVNDFQIIKAMFEKLPKKRLAFFPTPVHKLETLSEMLGVNLYLKRDDLSGVTAFSSSKIRKLEYLLGDAIKQGADTIVTYGPLQSNHVMQTASACRIYGLSPILYMVAPVGYDEDDAKANMLVNEIMGAEIHIVPSGGEPLLVAYERAYALSAKRVQQLESEGKKVCVFPSGGSCPIGDVGFAEGIVELHEQMMQQGIKMDYVVHSSASGGMLSGLAAGKALLESDVSILTFRTSDKKDDHPHKVAEMSTEILKLLGSDKKLTAGDLNIDGGYYAPGYEKPNKGSDEAIKLMARKEGILIDPIYTGKALYGLIDYIKKGKVPKGSNIVFWHAGGTIAFFAEKSLLGDIRN